MRAPNASNGNGGGGGNGSSSSSSSRPPRDARAQLRRTHLQRLGLVYLPLEALLTPLHLALCAAFLRPWAAVGNVVFFCNELLRALYLLLRWRIGLWEALRTVAAAFVALPTTRAEGLALLLVYVARALAVWTRYRCSFGAAERKPSVVGVLLAGHAAAGLLMSLAFLIRAGGPGGAGLSSALMLPHHGSVALLAGLGSALADAYLVFYRRGLQSSRGEGPFARPPPPSGHRLLARGFDQGLFEVKHFTGADANSAMRRRQQQQQQRRRSSGGGGGGGNGVEKPAPLAAAPVPRYARMLFPPLPDPPHDLPFFIKPTAPEWARWVGRVVLKRAWLLFEASEAASCLYRALATGLAVALAVRPLELLLRLLGRLTGTLGDLELEDAGVVGSVWQWAVLSKVASTALSLSLAVYSGLALSTLILYHILAQPVDFGNFSTALVSKQVVVQAVMWSTTTKATATD